MLECKPCFSIDVLCGLAHLKDCRGDFPDIKAYLTDIGQGLSIVPSVWSLNNVLAQNLELGELEDLNLDGLLRTYPDLMDGYDYILSSKKDVIVALERLAETGFDHLWHREVLPLIDQWCNQVNSAVRGYEFAPVWRDLKAIKPGMSINQVTVYMSYFSHPVSFILTPSSYVTCNDVNAEVDVNSLIQLMIHELSHGFMTDELSRKYQAAVEADAFLKDTHRFLTEYCGSTNEEEFVVAIEHALAVKHGLETSTQVKQKLFGHYGSCMPLAVILFHWLMQEPDFPPDISRWFLRAFDRLVIGRLSNQADDLFPGYSTAFCETLVQYGANAQGR